MARRKPFKELDLSNSFLFAAALEDEEICRLVLEIILGKPVGTVKVKPERTILFHSDYRCVRLDIYASGENGDVYNLEMQNENEQNLPKRSRYHQAELDAMSLKPGQDFNDLKPSVIVFLCTFDPFGKKRYCYTFEQRCVEEDFPLGDETKRIFLNTKGKNEEEVSQTLVHFLKYVENSTDGCAERTGDVAVCRIHDKVKELKKSRELEERYMQFEELLQKEHKAGIEEGHRSGMEEGHREGTRQMLALISCMAEHGEAEKILCLEEEAFLEEMLKKYQL